MVQLMAVHMAEQTVDLKGWNKRVLRKAATMGQLISKCLNNLDMDER